MSISFLFPSPTPNQRFADGDSPKNQQLKDAYETLSEPDKKAQYDESRQSRHAFTQGADYMAPQAATAGPSSHQGGYYAPPNAARRQPQADDFYQHMYQRHNAYWNKIHAQYNGRYAGPAWQRPGGSEYNRENDARMREDESSRMGIPIPDIPDRDPQRAQYLDQRRQCLDQKREDELQFEMETTETFNQDAYKQWLNDEDVFGV
jgi:curved DNA-binding protein CbpA